jgi:N-acetylneuraminic acid mutarotase
MFPLLNCCVAAVVERLGKLQIRLVVPNDGGLFEVVEFGADVWVRWKKQKPVEADRREEIQALAHASPERVGAAVQAAIQAEAAGQPAAVKRTLTSYLTQVHDTVRRALSRPGDPEGRTAPADVRINSAKDLVPLLPPQPPRFEPGESDSPRRGLSGWLWLAGGAGAVVGVIAVVLLVGNGWLNKPDGPPVAEKSGDDRPKDADKAKVGDDRPTAADKAKDANKAKDSEPEPKKDKTNPPEKPAPLPRLATFPKLSLPERGAADLQVKVERQGYAGPISLQVDGLPPGVSCQRTATIPASESELRLEFRTDGTAAEGTAIVELIAVADARMADRQKLSLVVPPKSVVGKPPETQSASWKSLANMPTGRSLLAVVTGPDGRIYAIGGENAGGRLDTVEVYDPSTNTWAKAASMPTARNHLAAAVGPNGLIYAIGGVSSIPKVVEAYDPITNKWTTVASAPTARHGMAAATGPDGRIYVFGGNGPAGSLNTVEAYDTKSNTWTTLANMPTARVYLAAATGADGRIYAIGGFVESDGKRLSTVEAYDTKTNTWTAVETLPTARNALTAATGPDGRIYAIGGDPVGDNLNPAEAYDPRTNKWSTVASMPTARRQLAAATGRDGRIYVIGGGHNGSFLNTVEALSFSTSK